VLPAGRPQPGRALRRSIFRLGELHCLGKPSPTELFRLRAMAQGSLDLPRGYQILRLDHLPAYIPGTALQQDSHDVQQFPEVSDASASLPSL